MKRHSLSLRPKAKKDIDEAAQWYHERSAGLGDDFLEAVERAIDGIEEYPFAFAVVHKNIRRSLLSKFPYALFYTVRESESEVRLAIIGCFHVRRDPLLW